MAKQVGVLVLATVVYLGACASGHSAAPQAVDVADASDALMAPDTATVVHARNQNWQDVDLFVVRPGVQVRLGMVTSMSTADMHIPASMLAGSPGLRIMIAPIGGPRNFMTPELQLGPGQTLELEIENNLNLTSYSIR